MPGERSMAATLGVGRAALRPILELLEQEGVLQRRPQSGTYLTAIPLPAVRCAHVCIIAPLQPVDQQRQGSETGWIHHVISAFERTAAPIGVKLTVLDQSPLASDPCSIIDLVKRAAEMGAHAVVLLHALGSRHKIAHALATASDLHMRPLVVSSRTYPGLASQVYFDSAWGAYFAARHLLLCGHRSIGFAGAASGHEWVQDRVKGYRAALEAADVQIEGEWVCMAEEGERLPAREDGANAVRGWLDLPADLRPTGVVAANDIVALGVLEECRANALSVPEQLSVIGFDNDPEALIAGLTTIERPTEALGEAVARVTLDRLAAGSDAEAVTVRLRPVLIERQTVARHCAPGHCDKS